MGLKKLGTLWAQIAHPCVSTQNQLKKTCQFKLHTLTDRLDLNK